MTRPPDLLDALLAHDVPSIEDLRSRATRDAAAGARRLVESLEAAVSRDPARFVPAADGTFTLVHDDRRYDAGRFATRTVTSLRDEVGRREGGCVRVSALVGSDVANDIGALQAFASEDTLFQVASQFNCLEATSARSLAPVASYFDDPTQGPRASISAFAGTLLRHHHAPSADGRRFEQTAARQIELLGEALSPDAGRVVNGYLLTDSMPDPLATAAVLEERWERIAVGVHAEVGVLLGAGWTGPVEGTPRIAQAFTSTFAASYCRHTTAEWTRALARPLLRASYVGTLLAALALGRKRVVLTLIGGGAFGNPHDLIWEAIRGACGEVLARGGELEVVVNAHSTRVAPEVEAWIASTGGVVVDVGGITRRGRSP